MRRNCFFTVIIMAVLGLIYFVVAAHGAGLQQLNVNPYYEQIIAQGPGPVVFTAGSDAGSGYSRGDLIAFTSAPNSPKVISRLVLAQYQSLGLCAQDGSYLWAGGPAGGGPLGVFDVRNPSNMVQVGSVTGQYTFARLVGAYCIAGGRLTVNSFSTNNPGAPTLVGSLVPAGIVFDVCATPFGLALAEQAGIEEISISAAGALSHLQFIPTPAAINCVRCTNNSVYALSKQQGLFIYNYSGWKLAGQVPVTGTTLDFNGVYLGIAGVLKGVTMLSMPGLAVVANFLTAGGNDDIRANADGSFWAADRLIAVNVVGPSTLAAATVGTNSPCPPPGVYTFSTNLSVTVTVPVVITNEPCSKQ